VSRNLPNQHKKSNLPKNPIFNWPFFKNKKKQKELKKSQKLQIWPKTNELATLVRRHPSTYHAKT